MTSLLRRRRLLTTSVLTSLALLGIADGSIAQTTPASPPPSAPPSPASAGSSQSGSPDTLQGVVVVGSRIKRNDFNSPSPIQVITAEQSTLAGLADTTTILQQASTAANANQINNFYTGFVTNGGPGVNTLDLRGLGPDRTLILLDGRRLGPAGTRGAVAAVDLNTIPSSIIDHVDILKDGASSIYGSDAVAGVVNIVTKKNTDGGEAHAYIKPTQYGGGNEYQADIAYSKSFNKGYFSVSGSIYEQQALYARQRKELNCVQDIATDPMTGNRLDLYDPSTKSYKCNNSAFINSFLDPFVTGANWVPSASAVAGGGLSGLDLNGLKSVGNTYGLDGSVGTPFGGPANAPFDIAASRASLAQSPNYSPLLGNNTAVSPVRRYTFFGTGGYEIDSHNQFYVQVLFNRRESSQVVYGQFFPILDPGNAFNIFNPSNANFTGIATAPYAISLYPIASDQRVDYGRIVAGFKGDVPALGSLKNWTYDIYAQYSRSDGTYGGDFIYNDRVNATAGSSNAAGCDPSAIAIGGGGKTLAQMEGANALCTPVNYSAAIFNNGQFTAAEQAYLFGYERGETIYDHAYLEGSVTGDLFTLPAGAVSAALGFHIRREDISDVPGANAQANNYWGLTSSGITRGADTVKEGFGEVRIPVVKNLPYIDSFEADLSGRYSSYNISGDAGTYKVGLDWKSTSWISFRASQGTSFRAPALFEHYLAPTSGFAGQVGNDPCVEYGQNHVSPIVAANCAAAGVPSNYNGQGASITVLQGGGSNLKPETSLAKTAGIVFTPHWFDLNFKIAADYFTYEVHQQIALFGVQGILTACYASQSYPNNPFCSLFTRDPSNHNILVVDNNYVNVSQQREQGLDVTTRFSHALPYQVNFSSDGEFTWTFDTKTTLLGGQSSNYLGTPGYPTFNGNISFRFDRGPWTVNWFTVMVGETSNLKIASGSLNNYLNLGLAANIQYKTPFYLEHTVSIRRKFGDTVLEAGVRNVFNQPPPAISNPSYTLNSTVGNAALASQYDFYGRSFFIDLDRKF